MIFDDNVMKQIIDSIEEKLGKPKSKDATKSKNKIDNLPLMLQTKKK